MQKSLLSLSMLALLAVSAGLGPGRTASPAAHGTAPVQAVPRSHRIAHRPAMAPHIPGPRYDTSQNWSGYVDTGSGVTDVTGTWTVPTLSSAPCPNAYSATWCGIDGWSSNTVEQLGTEQDFINGQQSNYAWWELYPHGTAIIPGTVTAGDTITASVHYDVTNGTFTLTMTSSGGISFTTTQTLRQARRSSAEWIEEAPFFGGILPLADFGTVGFSNCSSTLGGPDSGIPVTMGSKFRGPGSQHDLAEPVSASTTSATIKWDACQ